MTKKLKKIDWREGAGAAMYYIALMWLILISAVFFLEYYQLLSHGSKSQLYADVVADGSAYYGNTGWGLDEDAARYAQKMIMKENNTEKYFDEIKVADITFANLDKNGKTQAIATSSMNDKFKNNTVIANGSTNTSTTVTNVKISANEESKAQITYSGGVKIVYEAWKHSWEYVTKVSGLSGQAAEDKQTKYVWGGGRGEEGEWEHTSDCSGFVSGVFRKCGYKGFPIGSWTGTMMLCGTKVSEGSPANASMFADARPGDIILYYSNVNDAVPDHVAIYAGEYNGVQYQVHNTGKSSFDGTVDPRTNITNWGVGSSFGVHFGPVSSYRPKAVIRRLVGTDGVEDEKLQTAKFVINGLNENQTKAYVLLKEAGFNDMAAAAIIGMWEGETNGLQSKSIENIYNNSKLNEYVEATDGTVFDPVKAKKFANLFLIHDKYTPRYAGVGISGWTAFPDEPYTSSGPYKLYKFATDVKHRSPWDLEVQVQFFIAEISGYGNMLSQEKLSYLTVENINRCAEKDLRETVKNLTAKYEGISLSHPDVQHSIKYNRIPEAERVLSVLNNYQQ